MAIHNVYPLLPEVQSLTPPCAHPQLLAIGGRMSTRK